MNSTFIKDDYLPFVIRIAENEDDLHKAVRLRQAAYARHVPELACKLSDPEDTDYAPGSVVLLAESKIDGQPLGTMRIQSNRYAKLGLEASVDLPDTYQGSTMAEPVRLGVIGERTGSFVKAMLIKALCCHCANNQIEWIVLAARKPLDRHYRMMMFDDVFGEGEFIPMKHAANIPHRVMSLKVGEIRSKARATNHPLFSLFFQTRHPDLDLSQEKMLYPVPVIKVPDLHAVEERIGAICT